MKRGVCVVCADDNLARSIHPQGWVPVETCTLPPQHRSRCLSVAFTPKGGCPLKPGRWVHVGLSHVVVAFTPKGGCPLKHMPVAAAQRAEADQ